MDPSTLPAWRELTALAATVGAGPIRELVSRRGVMGVEACGLWLDVSLQRIDADVLAALARLAEQSGVDERRAAMFAGAPINETEGRAVLHTALRAPRGTSLVVDGVDVVAEVHEVLDRMTELAHAIRDGEWRGATGERITAIVNIGIGGSDLGPAMAAIALRPYADRELEFRFVSNVDPTDLATALTGLDPARTLFLVASKTFTTSETMANARAARTWVTSALGPDAVSRHFIALSTNAAEVTRFGIDASSMLGFWDWVGGRFSMDSAIGFSTMVLIGPERFTQLLGGFHDMDEHFATAPWTRNLPALMGLLAVWNRSFLGIESTAVLPYAHLLARFPAYLQQLTMESNGKSVRLDGAPVSYATGAIYWGEPGTNGQHSFYQLLHQGTSDVACDVVVVARNRDDVGGQQRALVANALAQASVLALGRTAAEITADGTDPALIAHKVMPGNRPVSVLMAGELDPRTFGALVALYEHSTFVQGAVWGINSFDQWGVELGKKVALGIEAAMIEGPGSAAEAALDPVTRANVDRYRSLATSGE